MKPEVNSNSTSQQDFKSQTPKPIALGCAASTNSSSASPIPSQRGTAAHAEQYHEYTPVAQGERIVATEGTGTPHDINVQVNGSENDNSDLGQTPFLKPHIPQATATTILPNELKHRRSRSAERPSKRTRPKFNQALDSEAFSKPISTPVAVTVSPLFFSSHTRRHRPALPTPYLSSETAASMLDKAREVAGGVTTLKLARGSISNNSPPRSASTPGSWASLDRGSSIPRSPGSRSKQSSVQILGSIGVTELLEQDERPTLIIDVANPVNFVPGAPLQIIFANASLRAHESIMEMVSGEADLNSPGVAVTHDFPEFKAWALSFVKNNECIDVSLPSFLYGGVTWTCSTLRKRLRIISGSIVNIKITGNASSKGTRSNSSAMGDGIRGASPNTLPKSPLGIVAEPSDYFGNASSEIPPFVGGSSPLETTPEALDMSNYSSPKQAMIAAQSEPLTSKAMRARYPEGSSFDWTRLPLSAALPRHIQFARSIDWAATALGPIEDWNFDLRAMCNLVMGSPHPAAMYWGDDCTAIYNEAYIMMAGHKHPTMMGQSYMDAWSEIWEDVKGVFSSAKESGQATMKDDDLLFIRRNGYLEESYFSWAIIPLIGEDGSVVGLYNPAFEKTRRKIVERRMLTLREVGEKTAVAREVRGFWGQVIKGLEYNEYDVPFVLLYSVSEDSDSELSSIHSGSLAAAPQIVLEGTLGVPQGHKAAVSPLDLKTSDEGFAPYLRESMKTDGPVLLSTEDGSLPFDLIDGMNWRGFGDPCRLVVVVPIHPTTGESILGFLVIGVNPRRPYDDDYSLFIQLLSRQIATSMASAMLFEEEIRRGQRAAKLAALDRQELSKQLDLRTQEAVESETKFTRMAEFAPVGMFIAGPTGAINYSNDTWWEITRHPRSENSANSWMNSIMDEDREEVRQIWTKVVKDGVALTHEFRFKTPWQDRNGNRGDTWVLMSAYPEKDENGQLKSVFGSITNISQQKYAEETTSRRMEAAIEMKRQQENFIDMTSHEMRNPLSAILQCADEISTSLSNYRSASDESREGQNLLELLDASIDAAQTIVLCSKHQKRIVDDILTLSKLDSALLVVTPVAVQPVSVVQRALKMFEGELETNDIAMEFRMEASYLDLNIDWVKLDPSRLLQVLINLTTNAIKFTGGQEKRTIIISIAASRERPDTDADVVYFPTRSNRSDLTTDEAEWGSGENIYLKFAVQDTGRGLDESEKTLLFQRFRQASPRTHVQYGGSGLGLFISRELTELQGGEIGVSSERGVGSTFAFYIKARRAEHMPLDTPVAASLNTLRKVSSSSNSKSVTIESRKNSKGTASHRSSLTGSVSKRPETASAPKSKTFSSATLDYSKLKVLIVEDNLVNQRVLQKQLQNIGFDTEVANHGGEALEVLKTSRFWKGNEKDGKELAIILMDLEMPIMDGLTCARTIRELEASGEIVRHVPIIAVTANARLEQIESAIGAGMDDVVSKPFRIPELTPKIEELVRKSNDTASSSK